MDGGKGQTAAKAVVLRLEEDDVVEKRMERSDGEEGESGGEEGDEKAEQIETEGTTGLANEGG